MKIPLILHLGLSLPFALLAVLSQPYYFSPLCWEGNSLLQGSYSGAFFIVI